MTDSEKSSLFLNYFKYYLSTSPLFLTKTIQSDNIMHRCAPVAELADAPDLGSGIFDVQVQALSGAPKSFCNQQKDFFLYRENLIMIIIITGASHTGKTALAQKLLEKYKYPYLSIDHLKMGLIRSGNTELTPLSDDKVLTVYLWPIVREIIKTAVENNQNLIVEGCYIPFDWKNDFENGYLDDIRCFCIVFTEKYINNYFNDIKKYANIIEKRIDDEFGSPKEFIEENNKIRELSESNGTECIIVDNEYIVDITL